MINGGTVKSEDLQALKQQQVTGFMQQGPQNPPRCECHECTQARWKSSMMGQLGAR